MRSSSIVDKEGNVYLAITKMEHSHDATDGTRLISDEADYASGKDYADLSNVSPVNGHSIQPVFQDYLLSNISYFPQALVEVVVILIQLIKFDVGQCQRPDERA